MNSCVFVAHVYGVRRSRLEACLGKTFAESADLTVLDPPIERDEFTYLQVWHKRLQYEPMLLWLRELIASQTSEV